MQKRWETIADRLRWAIKSEEHRRPDTPNSYHAFQKAMGDRKEELEAEGATLHGCTYPTIIKYVRGEGPALPRLEFLREAAAILKVDADWLIVGVGEPTAEFRSEGFAAAMGHRRIQRDAAVQNFEKVASALWKGFGGWLPWDAPMAGLMHAWRRWSLRHLMSEGRGSESEDEVDQIGLRAAEEIGRAARAPLEALRMPSLSSSQLNLYLLSMVPVLSLLAEMYPEQTEDS